MKRLGIAALVLMASVLAAPARAQEGGIMLGATAPAAMVRSLDGKELDLSSYYGEKPVVLEFWATWCPLCRKLEPAMQAARATYGDRVTFVSVGVSANQTADKQREYAEKKNLGGEFVFDYEDAATKAFSVPHTSYIVVIGRDKKVVYTGVGPEQDVDAAVRKALP